MKQKIFKYKDIYKQNKLKKTAIYQGMWGLKAVQSGIITDKQLETVRKTIIQTYWWVNFIILFLKRYT